MVGSQKLNEELGLCRGQSPNPHVVPGSTIYINILVLPVFELPIDGVTLDKYFCVLMLPFNVVYNTPVVVCSCGSCISIVAYYPTQMSMPHYTLDDI